ncbi:gamma-tubulin complex component 3 isoform X2 [Atheta coriaria]|uniref:gamma-tubulin complex component 3 isoform X2 n=1 Tax=Dalotia coriaria TaxID=877792 RepID=UPI0031F36216
MNGSTQDVSTTIPLLVNKLCSHFAKNNEEQSNRFYKLCVGFLSLPQHNDTLDKDESQIAAQIRKFIQATKGNEETKLFDALYLKIHKSAVLHHKSHLLSFFLFMSKGNNKFESSHMWSIPKQVLHSNPISVSSKNQIGFLPDDSSAGVKKIYQSNLNRKMSNVSSRTHSGVSYTNSDSEIYKDQLTTSTSSSRSTTSSVSEAQLLQEVIYSFQGIEGKVIRKEPGGIGFTLDPKASKCMTARQKGLILRLTGIGFLHNQLKQHCDEADKQIGLIGQSLIAILRIELTSYYELIAHLQAQAKKQSSHESNEISLRRMVVWVAEPQLRLQWLAYIAEQCVDKKGGALISAIHGFLQHGSYTVQKQSEKVLAAVCRPLYVMLSKWLLDGELNDPCGEFFIEARMIKDVERLWHDKYHVRKAMIPTFITVDQANKILATGKSINFLRQICKDTAQLPGRETLQKLFSNSLEAFFNPERSIELHAGLESVYRETSTRVLDLLKNKYMLLEHLQAMRRYLLLGQGDFIRHLLELLAPELCQPAYNLYAHTLSAILESAIRVTNAQYDDEETISCLNVCLMQHSNEDTGWDVFSLMYCANGPVGTIFQPTVSTYKCLFGGLWKAKRMEFVLSNMRKQQITSNKLLKQMKELRVVTHQIHVLSSEMIHFLHQTQYYFLFEVLECSWAEMLKQVNQAACLDDVITAHNTFLASVQTGILLDLNSAELRKYLGSIFNLVLSLESVQETLYSTALKEREHIIEHEKLFDTDFGITVEIELENRERTGRFSQFLTTMNSQINSISCNFRQYVVKYVTLLATSSDMNLQLLATRINFNDYYKIM